MQSRLIYNIAKILMLFKIFNLNLKFEKECAIWTLIPLGFLKKGAGEWQIKKQTLLNKKQQGNIVLYKKVEVRLEHETGWLAQKQMAELFNTERRLTIKHIHNIFKSKELEEKRNVQKMHILNSVHL